MEIQVLAEGLRFPEGPIAMPDGSVILVEIARGTLTRVWNGKTEVIAHLGGGPNGAALGPDGAIYVCNNGGFEWHNVNGLLYPGRAAADYTTGRIERVDLATGRFERLYDSFEGERLGGPNDLVFDRSGGFWFTDLGKRFARQRDHSGLYYARPDGSHLHKAVYPAVSFNGVGLSPDEKVVYCNDTDSGRLWAFDIESPGRLVPFVPGGPRGRVVGTVPSNALLDSLAVEENGNVCSATLIHKAGITVFLSVVECSRGTPSRSRVVKSNADQRHASATSSSTSDSLSSPSPG